MKIEIEIPDGELRELFTNAIKGRISQRSFHGLSIELESAVARAVSKIANTEEMIQLIDKIITDRVIDTASRIAEEEVARIAKKILSDKIKKAQITNKITNEINFDNQHEERK